MPALLPFLVQKHGACLPGAGAGGQEGCGAEQTGPGGDGHGGEQGVGPGALHPAPH